ncbi:acyl-coenzyme A:6-aminopenicillanic acid acyl-transferase [Clostridium acetireducens DSM 10703]|uniref:Acyl-coenzyme A:6-aminopenicillanic acid acyl-transferase n=1 Tax=Clostridium acetireducens DSM 10703 TaxID=1121290 RepID=A0A1E8EWZ0_9CLOT|nr:C45 family peptidase [Clostridium acetireducens]OFI01513.1 acyl-coenzyme A:6-aminopenicillanic acid acyl-transferase [Clostridium acetireducens DSM 10703]
MNNNLQFIELNGSPYERGKKSGIFFKNILHKTMKNYEKYIKNESIYNQMKLVEKSVKKIFPNYLEEIYGRADGSGINKDLYFISMCAELINEGVGCTSIAYKKPNGNFILSHNEDDAYEPGASCITKCVTEKSWFAGFDYCRMAFGNAFSWNSYGIVKTINFCTPININPNGIPRYFIQRHISEACSIEDFINRCNIPNRASGFHAIALDINKNIAISVEVTDKNINIIEIDDYYIHTNHYIHKNICNGKLYTNSESTSLYRYNKTKELMNKLIKNNTVNKHNINKILNYRGHYYQDSILAIKGEPNFTCANFTIDTETKNNLYIKSFTTNENLVIDYNH